LQSRSGAGGISFKGIVKRYGAVHALDSVDLDISGGEFMTLLGPSGSGKSTLLMVLAGFVRPDRGDIRLGGKSIIGLPPHRRNAGMVFQKHALFPHMTVFDNIAYPLRLRSTEKNEIRRKVEEVLALVRLEGYGDRRIDQLSGGQSQRVAVARAIVFSPGVLLMDEPLSALDKNLREQLQIEIRALHDRLGLTTVYVTHDQREALTMSDRIAVMDRGRIAQVATARDLYDRPANSFVAGFVGEATLVPVKRDGDGARALGEHLPAPLLPPDAGEPLFLVIRPGMLELAPQGNPESGYLHFHGAALRPVFEGETLLHQIDCGDGIVLRVRRDARTAPGRAPEPGEKVTLRMAHRDVALVPKARE
jgi:putative spermidine/putrescine transport system ATP-binding protein